MQSPSVESLRRLIRAHHRGPKDLRDRRGARLLGWNWSAGVERGIPVLRDGRTSPPGTTLRTYRGWRGESYTSGAPPVLCLRGFHAAPTIAEGLAYARGPFLSLVDIGGLALLPSSGNKFVGTTRRTIVCVDMQPLAGRWAGRRFYFDQRVRELAGQMGDMGLESLVLSLAVEAGWDGTL